MARWLFLIFFSFLSLVLGLATPIFADSSLSTAEAKAREECWNKYKHKLESDYTSPNLADEVFDKDIRNPEYQRVYAQFEDCVERDTKRQQAIEELADKYKISKIDISSLDPELVKECEEERASFFSMNPNYAESPYRELVIQKCVGQKAEEKQKIKEAELLIELVQEVNETDCTDDLHKVCADENMYDNGTMPDEEAEIREALAQGAEYIKDVKSIFDPAPTTCTDIIKGNAEDFLFQEFLDGMVRKE